MSSRKRKRSKHDQSTIDQSINDQSINQVKPEEIALIVHRYLQSTYPNTAKAFQTECRLIDAFFIEHVDVSIPPLIDLSDMINEFVELKQHNDNRRLIDQIASSFRVPNQYDDPRTALMQSTLTGVYNLLEQFQQQLNRPAIVVNQQPMTMHQPSMHQPSMAMQSPPPMHQSTSTSSTSRKRKSHTPVRQNRESSEEADQSTDQSTIAARTVSQVFPLDFDTSTTSSTPFDFMHRVQIDGQELANNDEFVNMLVENINQHRSSIGGSSTDLTSIDMPYTNQSESYDLFPSDLLEQVMPLMANAVAIDGLVSPLKSPQPVSRSSKSSINRHLPFRIGDGSMLRSPVTETVQEESTPSEAVPSSVQPDSSAH